MSSKILLSALAAVAAIVVVAAPQDPTFEFPAAKHAGFNLPKDSSQTAAPADRISVSFKNATVREVLDWLKNQGVNFVVGDDQVDKDGHINVNVLNQPVENLMKALAAAWDGHWDRKGDIWVFREGDAPFLTAPASNVLSTKAEPDQPAVNAINSSEVHISTSPFATAGQGDAKLSGNAIYTLQAQASKDQDSPFRKAFQNGNDSKSWAEFARKWEQWAREYEKNFQEFEKNFKGQNFDFKFDDKQLQEIEKQAQEMAKQGRQFRFQMKPGDKGSLWQGQDNKPFDEKQLKEMERAAQDWAKQGEQFRIQMKPGQKGFTWDGKDFKPIDEKQLREIEKQARQMAKDSARQFKAGQRGFIWEGQDFKPLDAKQLEAIRKQADEMAKQGLRMRQGLKPGANGFSWDGEKIKALTDKQLKELGMQQLEFGKAFGKDGKGFAWTDHSSAHNLKAIFDLLTPSQEQKMKRLGYINYSDLNAKQRSLLGMTGDDHWTISYKTDKVNLTIKSDR